MPIYVGYTQKRRAVKLLTAGNNKVYLCDPGEEIELRADINDYTNIRNHIFEWVQIDGPVILLNKIDDFSVSYPFADSFDKTFRFYIDRGTPQQQFEDVTIFYTPTSIHYPIVSTSEALTNLTPTVPNRVETTDLQFDSFNIDFEWNLIVDTVTRIDFSDLAPFYEPGTVIKYVVYKSTDFRIIPDNVYLSFDGNNYPNVLFLPKGIYRFEVTFDVNGYVNTVMSRVFVSYPKQKEDYYAVNTQHSVGLADARSTAITRFLITRELFMDAHTITHLTKAEHRSLTRFTTKILNFIIEPQLNTSHSITHIADSRHISMLRINPSNIGNE